MPQSGRGPSNELAILKRMFDAEHGSDINLPADNDPWAPPTEDERVRAGLPRTQDIELPRDNLPSTRTMPLATYGRPAFQTDTSGDPSGRLALARMLGVDTSGDSGGGDDQRGIADQPFVPVKPANDPRIASAILTGGGMSANVPQAVARARDSERGDLETRVANDAALAAIPREGFVPGEPGRRYLDQSAKANLITDSARLGLVNRDIADDPYTGTAETARIGGIRSALDTAAMTQRPEIGDAAKTVATRNAFAEYMKQKGLKMADYEAAGSPAAYDAGLMPQRIAASGIAQDNARRAAMLPIDIQNTPEAQRLKDLDVAREGVKKMQPSLVPGMFPTGEGEIGDISDPRTGMSYTLPPNLKALSAADQGAVKAFGLAAPMLGDLKAMLDPNKNQLPNSVMQHAKWALYQMGISPDVYMNKDDPKEQARLQLASMVKIIAGSPYLNGSRNFNFIKQIQNHLTNPVATDKFLYNQITELEERWPEMMQEIIQRHINPGAPLNFNDPWAPPSRAERTQKQFFPLSPEEVQRQLR